MDRVFALPVVFGTLGFGILVLSDGGWFALLGLFRIWIQDGGLWVMGSGLWTVAIKDGVWIKDLDLDLD